MYLLAVITRIATLASCALNAEKWQCTVRISLQAKLGLRKMQSYFGLFHDELITCKSCGWVCFVAALACPFAPRWAFQTPVMGTSYGERWR